MKWLALKLLRFLSDDDLRRELTCRGYIDMTITAMEGMDRYEWKGIGIKEKIK